MQALFNAAVESASLSKLSKVLPLLRANSVFVCLLAAGGLLRLLVWWAYQPAILVLADSYYYLRAATVGTGLGADRPFLYSLGFIKPLLALSSLSLVTAVQHLLSLATAALIYALLRRLDVPRILAAAGAALLLVDGYQLNIEQHILAETLFESLSVSGLAAIVWFRKGPVAIYLLGGVLLSLSSITRFVGLALLPLAITYLAVIRAGWIRLCALIVGISIPLVVYPALLDNGGDNSSLKYRVGLRLYGKVASFADCSQVKVPRDERQLCIDKKPSQRRHYYSPWSHSTPTRRMNLPPEKREAVVTSFTMRFLRAQPQGFARVVSRDFLRFFSWTSTNQLAQPPIKRWEFFTSKREFYSQAGTAWTFGKFRQTQGAPPPELGLNEHLSLNREISKPLSSYQSLFYARGPLLAFLVLLGVLGAIFGREPEGSQSSCRGTCLLFTLSGVALYLFPATFATFHFRYVISALPMLGPGGAMGAWLLLSRVSDLRAAKHRLRVSARRSL